MESRISRFLCVELAQGLEHGDDRHQAERVQENALEERSWRHNRDVCRAAVRLLNRSLFLARQVRCSPGFNSHHLKPD